MELLFPELRNLTRLSSVHGRVKHTHRKRLMFLSHDELLPILAKLDSIKLQHQCEDLLIDVKAISMGQSFKLLIN